jgi:hypothetical protein
MHPALQIQPELSKQAFFGAAMSKWPTIAKAWGAIRPMLGSAGSFARKAVNVAGAPITAIQKQPWLSNSLFGATMVAPGIANSYKDVVQANVARHGAWDYQSGVGDAAAAATYAIENLPLEQRAALLWDPKKFVNHPAFAQQMQNMMGQGGEAAKKMVPGIFARYQDRLQAMRAGQPMGPAAPPAAYMQDMAFNAMDQMSQQREALLAEAQRRMAAQSAAQTAGVPGSAAVQ